MIDVTEAVRARADLNRTIRGFFERHDFVEVETPALVPAPGTDLYLDPVEATLHTAAGSRRRWLHTSPEFAMKELLVEGLERIYQLCHVWRDGERTPQHNPEFTILEWYRADETYDAIMDDVEALVREILPDVCDVLIPGYEGRVEIAPKFPRRTMREVWLESCDVDPIATAGDPEALGRMATERGMAPRRPFERWDEWFFHIWFEGVEPWLRQQGAVFVTEWPSQLAVLAQRCAHDPRVAERFELYVGGVELANGFGELTDPVEQRERFALDNAEREATGKETLPMPERLLGALERGLPPSSGVALGVDRLLMLASGASRIAEVLPFAEE